MTGAARYHITALPGLGGLGSTPPLELSELLERFADLAWAREPMAVILLQDDLTQRESFLSGEFSEVKPAVLNESQARNEAPLPDYLITEENTSGAKTLEVDRLWETYFRHAAGVAEQYGNRFLQKWVAFEVGLRNALASARAQRLGLDVSDYRVATDLEDGMEDFSDVIDEWAQADNPLAGLRALISARWGWVDRHDAWFTFRGDELTAYTARLLLLHQWYRLDKAEQTGSAAQTGEQASANLERIIR